LSPPKLLSKRKEEDADGMRKKKKGKTGRISTLLRKRGGGDAHD